MEITIAFVAAAFVAGVLTFLAPCTLPLLPAYLAFISGIQEDLTFQQKLASQTRQKIFKNALSFVVGFSFVFILFGVLAGLVGFLIGPYRVYLVQIGGLLILFFGLMMLHVVPLPSLFRDKKVTLPRSITPGNPVSAFLIGATFALGWTPCVGPILASIFLLASTTATIVSGVLLLSVFSLGLAIPFLLTAVLYARATHLIFRYGVLTKWISTIGGVFLIIIGVLLITDQFGLMVSYGYQLFNAIGFESLFEYF